VVEWNYFIEQRLTQNMSIRVGYVGSHAYHNIIDIDANTIAPQICSDPNGCLAGGLRSTVGACPPAPGNSCVPQGTQYFPPGKRPNPYLGSAYF